MFCKAWISPVRFFPTQHFAAEHTNTYLFKIFEEILFCFVHLVSFLSCYVFVNLGEKELPLVISFFSVICKEHTRLVHHVKVFLVGMKLCAVYSLLKVLTCKVFF